ncbi:site-specific DNA-methyltransferase [Streptomyces sp. NPDC005900]|uniref:site-specific DNA-methyltransferase n=1 Tax=Streptomyces sp. NPDC005900 TaxID=3154569 RepID=UPI0033C9E2F5
MTSVAGETADGQDELLAQLRDLVPSAFLDGELDRGALLDALGLSDDDKPAFAFTWPGIDRARQDARAATSATLVPDEDASLSWGNARDVLIEGDNLQVLKLLKNGYSRTVKLIYIDPPYNTGDTFTYNDDFAVPESQYLADTGQVDDQGNATTSRIETGGRKHAPWLTMMFPRLALARHLLRRDGVILVSIDNNEVHHLRLLLDAVFGAENFVDMMTWRGARKGDAKLTGGGQDYILVYARDRSFLKANDVRWRERKEGLEPIYAKVDELRAEHGDDYDVMTAALRNWYKSLADENPSKAHAHYNRVDEKGVWFSDNISSPNYRENLIYDWKGYSPPANGWRYEKPTMERLDAEGRLVYPEDTTRRVQIKAYLHTREEWAPTSVFYRDRRAASTNLDALMGTKVFDDPKSTDVLARLFHAITDDGDLILDFFAGSGSTGHAVWEQNPKDGKTRHWILVQVPEKPDPSETSGKSALDVGYETIFEITAERLRRVAKALPADTSDTSELGFRIFRTRPTNLIVEKPIKATPELTAQTYLAQVLDDAESSPVVDGANPIDVAWEVALKATGTRLDARVVTHDLNGVTVYEFVPSEPDDAGGRLLISLDAFTLAAADALSLNDSDTVILRGDKVEDSVTLTLAPRLHSKLILLERVPREVSL